VVEVEPEQEGKVADESQPVRKPIVKSGRGDTRLPLIMAAAAGAILLIGYLAGAHGLFPPVVNANNEVVPGADIAFGQRMLGLLRFVISDAMWTLCALGGLVFLAFLLSMRLGDGILAAARMLGIITVAHLATFINFSSNALEFIVESIIEAGIFVGLSIVLFNLKPKDTPTLLGSTIMLFMILWLGAKTVVAILG
jgi:hypothetical protein